MILMGRDGKIVELGIRAPALEEAVKRAIKADEHSSLLDSFRLNQVEATVQQLLDEEAS